MYSKFNYKPDPYFYNRVLNNHLTSGNKLYAETERKSKASLRKFVLDNGSIDGTALKNHWFNVDKADIFLSHSHKDIEKVKAFAGWLYDKFQLRSFIDSCVWGYCDELLKEIDDIYCKNEGGQTYSYELRNYSTSHVHAMLSSAISEMIDKSECIIFFNTPNSIVLNDELNKMKEKAYNNQYTNSPWIYHELSVTQMIRRDLPLRKKKKIFLSAMDSLHESHYMRSEFPEINYEIEKYLTEMKSLTDADLQLWSKNHNSQTSGENALDELYDIVNSDKKS